MKDKYSPPFVIVSHNKENRSDKEDKNKQVRNICSKKKCWGILYWPFILIRIGFIISIILAILQYAFGVMSWPFYFIILPVFAASFLGYLIILGIYIVGIISAFQIWK